MLNKKRTVATNVNEELLAKIDEEVARRQRTDPKQKVASVVRDALESYFAELDPKRFDTVEVSPISKDTGHLFTEV